jgi:tRNA pseudouridine38-40 synthase
MRLKLTIAYDGRPFAGWQSQASGNTVQDRLERALEKICARRIVVHGAGRTDAGVHALAQVAHIDVDDTLPRDRWLPAINANLPREIRVLRCSRAQKTFHARISAKRKIYTYRIWNAPIHSPFEVGRSWHFFHPLDLDVMRACAKKLTGTHDFASFAANRGKPDEDTTRTIFSIDVKRKGALVTLTFNGTGFLYKMVRLLTGSLVRVAQGRAEPEWISRLLAAPGKTKTSFAAPADGLYLVHVFY